MKALSEYLLLGFSEDYKDFIQSSLEFKKRLIRWMRIGISSLLILYMILIFPFTKTKLFEQITYPLFFFINLTASTLLLKKRFEKYCSIYITFLLLLFLEIGIELVFIMEKPSADLGVFYGMEVGLFFSLFLISRLPFRYLLICSTILTIHLFYRIFTCPTADFPLLTAIIFFFIIFLLNIIYNRQESLEFKIWKDLQRSLKSMQQFQQLIQVFPSEIIIINEKSWAKDTVLYMNEEAEKKIIEVQQSLSIQSFLEQFSLMNSPDERSPTSSWRNEFPQIINDFFSRDKMNTIAFENYIASLSLQSKPGYKAQNEKNDFFNILSDRKNGLFTENSKIESNKNEPENIGILNQVTENDQTESFQRIKYDIKMGKIEWGSEDALILILSDISTSERIRELINLHENKDKLLATVSHELRTPLNGIIGMLDIVEEKTGQLDLKIKKYITIARNSAKTLLFMINDILDISQIQKGKLRLNINMAPIHNLIDEVLPLVGVQIQKKGLQLQYENLVPEGTKVSVDPMRFQQILLNLLSNAFKFTNTGIIRVKVEEMFEVTPEDNILLDTVVEPAHNKSIVVSVTDTGLGIKQENLSSLFKLFGKFEQIGNPTGVGLGLAISQKLAQQMHPRGISVRSVYGQGSCFSFPVYRAKEESKTDCHSNLLEFVTAGSIRDFGYTKSKVTLSEIEMKVTKKFLIVDDDQVNKIVISKYLTSLGLFPVVDKVNNGLEAIELIQKNAGLKIFYDIIFMDCNMPVMDGFTATKRIRMLVQDGFIPDLKIVALTANVSEADRKKCLESGMNEVWNKPIQRKDFMEQLQALVGQSFPGN